MLDVERWAELRREHFVRGVPIKELVRRTGLARNTIRTALRSDQPPAFSVAERPSKLDQFKDEIHRLLKDDPKLPGVRVREEIEPLGFWLASHVRRERSRCGRMGSAPHSPLCQRPARRSPSRTDESQGL